MNPNEPVFLWIVDPGAGLHDAGVIPHEELFGVVLAAAKELVDQVQVVLVDVLRFPELDVDERRLSGQELLVLQVSVLKDATKFAAIRIQQVKGRSSVLPFLVGQNLNIRSS